MQLTTVFSDDDLRLHGMTEPEPAAWFFGRWRAYRRQVRSDAVRLTDEQGAAAYIVACRLAKAERSGQLVSPSVPRGHWEKVRREVKRGFRS